MVRYIHTQIQNVSCTGNAPKGTGYTMEQRMICASICAYAVNHSYVPGSSTNFQPECQFWAPIDSAGPTHLITAKKAWSHEAVDAAFVTQTDDGWVVLSLRGTEPPSSIHGIGSFIRFVEDWAQDSETEHVPFFVGRTYYGGVHKGFDKAYKAMRPKVKEALDTIDWDSVKGLQITGHSKGAALTFYYALWAKHTYSKIKSIQVNAYAPPPIGDAMFGRSFENAKIPTVRYGRFNDSVPFLVPFIAQDGSDIDIYEYMHFGFNGTEDLFWTMGKAVNSGYVGIGDFAYLPGDPPGSIAPETGMKGLSDDRWQVISTVKADKGGIIAAAHSAKESYYPALVPASMR